MLRARTLRAIPKDVQHKLGVVNSTIQSVMHEVVQTRALAAATALGSASIHDIAADWDSGSLIDQMSA